MNSKNDNPNRGNMLGNRPGMTHDQHQGTGNVSGTGGHGYDPNREQQEVNKEREEMQKERDPKRINIEEPEKQEGREADPGKETPQPNKPSTGSK